MKTSAQIAAVVAVVLGASTIISLIAAWMFTMEENIVYYMSPTEIHEKGDAIQQTTIRLGGQVVAGSVDFNPDDQRLVFRVTDGESELPVNCTGAPPQMFREGIGVVVEGQVGHDGVFHTDRVLIKHSNEYRSPEDGEDPADIYRKNTLLEDGT